MGTRSEIHIRAGDAKDYEVIELWKHWDGGPEGMKELFTEFGAFMKASCGDQPHRLFYPQDLSALLIAHSYLDAMERNKMRAKGMSIRNRECYPDIRPRGGIEDCEYVYLLEVVSPDKTYANARLHVKCYSTSESPELRKQFKEGTEPAPVPPTYDGETESAELYEYDIPLNLPGQSGLMAN